MLTFLHHELVQLLFVLCGKLVQIRDGVRIEVDAVVHVVQSRERFGGDCQVDVL